MDKMWKKIQSKIALEPPVPFHGNKYLGCTQYDVETDSKQVQEKSDLYNFINSAQTKMMDAKAMGQHENGEATMSSTKKTSKAKAKAKTRPKGGAAIVRCPLARSPEGGPETNHVHHSVGKAADDSYRWLDEDDLPQSIGRLSGFMGNAGVLLRAYVYARMLGRDGMHRVAEFAALNANYLMARLREAGFDPAFPDRRASHEFIITLKRQNKSVGVTATDVAKRLLDHGFHAPTVYFPLLVPECLLIEPTETESKEALDGFIDAMIAIAEEAEADIEQLRGAPYTMPVRRLDDVRAARQLDVRYQPEAAA